MNALKIIGYVLLSLILFWALIVYLPGFSAFGAALLIIGLAVGLLWAVDYFLLKNFNTLEELKDGNVAVALALVAYAILLGFAIMAAFSVWH